MKCSSMLHFIRVCTVCQDDDYEDEEDEDYETEEDKYPLLILFLINSLYTGRGVGGTPYI